MFDEQQSRRRELSLTRPLIVIACAGGGIMLSFGLCGAATIPAAHSSNLAATLSVSGLVLMTLSIIGILVGFLWLVVAAIINAIRN